MTASSHKNLNISVPHDLSAGSRTTEKTVGIGTAQPCSNRSGIRYRV
jgi:hypothetical protein